MSSRKRHENVAHVEDAEEDSGSSIGGDPATRKYALSEAPSPTKERPNTGKSRGSERRPSHRRSESSSASMSLTDSSDNTARSSRKEKEARRLAQKEAEREMRELEKRRERKALKVREEMERRAKAEVKAQKEAQKEAEKAARKARPTSLRHSVTQPVVQQSTSTYRRGHVNDPSCYGVAQPAPSASNSRPRAQTRPASYYAGQSARPPIANMGWHQSHHQQPMAPYPPVVGTFPPPANHMFPPPSPASTLGGGPSPLPMSGYFDNVMNGQHNHLKQRFENRPSSAMGFHSPSIRGYTPEEFEDDVPSHRTASHPRKRYEDDTRKMPPPNYIPRRPQSAMPQSTPFAPPPPPKSQRAPPTRTHSRTASSRRSVNFAADPSYPDEDLDFDMPLFQDSSPKPANEPRRTPSGRRRISSSIPYGQQALDIMPSSSRGRNMVSYAGGAAVGSYGASLAASYEDDKVLDALRYQEDVSGPGLPLTAESLRKASKPKGVPSSRSTRSSGSHDDSDYRRSNTTGLTRSSSGGQEDVVIKFSGTSVVRLQGAEIECSDGEITFSRGGMGSDMASTILQLEDNRSRVERKALPHRIRAPSQSDSQSRGYAPSHAPYDTAPYDTAPYDPTLNYR